MKRTNIIGTALLAALTFASPVLAQEPAASAAGLLSGGNQLVVPLYKSRVLRLDAPAARVSVGNPDVADILILRSTQLYVLGKDLGTTNVLVWDSEDRLIGTVNVEVGHDLDNLKEKLFQLLPGEPILVYSSQRSIVLAGEVSGAAAMDAALQVARTYLAQVSTAVDAAQFNQESQSNRDDRSVGQVINLMRVGGVQQVMLDIKVAEINRAELKRMHAQFNYLNLNDGSTLGGVNGGATFPDVVFPDGRAPVFPGTVAPWGPAIDEFAPRNMTIQNQGFFASFLSPDSLFNMALDIAKENRLAKVLAEPTLTTLTGQEARFLSGGEIAIPVPQGIDQTTFEFKEFGIIVTFLPVVLDSGLINLKVDVSVSEITRLDPASLIPLQLGTRRASASVELREGQTMGLAGLIDSNLREVVTKFPGLGSIPVLGALFRSQDYINEETELVMTVTPRLAKPMVPADVRLPTDNFIAPGDAEFFLLGKLEGRGSGEPRSDDGSAAVTQAGAEGTFGHQLD